MEALKLTPLRERLREIWESRAIHNLTSDFNYTGN
jgi:hypothetical protein